MDPSKENPIVEKELDRPDPDKKETIREHMMGILQTLGIHPDNKSLKETPERIAEMYVEEIFSGLHPRNKPTPETYPNEWNGKEPILQRSIPVFSFCEHHFVPIIGHADVKYVPRGELMTSASLEDLVEYYCKRPQVQERLTEQIAEELKGILKTDDIAVRISADHLCVAMRGIKDPCSDTVTAHFSGKFDNPSERKHFLRSVQEQRRDEPI